MTSNNNSNSSLALAATTGVAFVCAGALIWKLSSKYDKQESPDGKDLCEVAQSLDVGAVGGLLSSPDAKVRKSAELFLMNRASSRKNLNHFLKICLSNDIDEVIKAVTVVNMLAQHSDEMKGRLITNKAVHVLRDVLERTSNHFDYKYLIKKIKKDPKIEKIFHCVIGSLFHLILRDSITTLQFCNEDACIKNMFLPIISDQGFHLSTDVKRWTLYMVHQLILCNDRRPIKNSLLQLGLVSKVTECLIKTLGDILQTHLCLQILIQFLTGFTPNEIMSICKEMITNGITPHLVGLLRCEEDDNVIQLSAIIIHHFCCYDLEIKYLVSIPSMAKILCKVLNNSNANIQKTIIRICNYLSVGSTTFQHNLLEHEPIIKRLSVCLSSGNPDVVYGSLMLLHDLIMPGKEYAYQIINKNPDILKALVKLALTYTGETAQLIPETLGFICSCESLHAIILQYGVLDAILHFAKSSDVEVQFWASALLLNLSMISDEIKESMIRCGGVHILLEMAVSGDEVDLPDIATNATKTLVMMGFLDATMKVKLVSGLEGSIVIDGTEFCPGKQGINAVVFDFINYQFQRGKVINPAGLLNFFEKPEFTISDSVFFVTQGDCTVPDTDNEVMKKYLKKGIGSLNSPSWCWIYMPNDMQIKFSEDNIELNTEIQMSDLLGAVLEENFTDPLIDVILSMPPSSNINKLDELSLIEILARHYHQRKGIVSTAGFLEYLFELIWSVTSLKQDEYTMKENKTKISHCMSALKIIHSCSNDITSLKKMVHRGLLQPLVSLLQELITYCYNECASTPSKKMSRSLSHSPKRELKFESNIKDEIAAKGFKNAIDEEPAGDDNDISYLGDCVTNLSYSDDNIFQSELDTALTSTTQVIAQATPADFEVRQEPRTTHVSTPNPRPSPRNRTDSFILRTNSQSHGGETMIQRSMSAIDGYSHVPGDESVSLSNSFSKSQFTRFNSHQTPDHNQLRRISRSMSLSLQQAKYTEEYSSQIKFSDDTLNKIGKYIVMIIYHLVTKADDEMMKKIMEVHLLPFLYGYMSCIEEGLHHERVWLAISSSFIHMSSQGKSSSIRHGVYMRHVDIPRSIIIRSDGLEMSNENWYFESAIANQAVSQRLYENSDENPAGWYYEVTVFSDGVMQIGWANESCKFFPEKGCGVGDTINSVGFDGARCKIWNGPSRDIVLENNYGVEWQQGDVISVVLSWDGNLNYWLNGMDMGESACTVDMNMLWYPSLSLAIGQHCLVSFTEKSFRYKPPKNYASIDSVEKLFADNVDNDDTTKNIRSLDDIFDNDTETKASFSDLHVLYYYEIDLLQLPKNTDISIGFKLFENIRSIKSNSSEPPGINMIEITKCIPATVLADGKEMRMKTIGCGLHSNHNFIMTLDGKCVFDKPVESMISMDIDASNFYFDVVPHISKPHILVNFGQKTFKYDFANSSMYKLLDNLCKLKDS